MVENVSPEERLFKVIQQGKESIFKGQTSQNKRMDSPILNQFLLNLNPFRKKSNSEAMHSVAINPDYSKATSITLARKFQEINLKVINESLSVVLAILISLVVYYTVNKKDSIAKITSTVSRIGFPTAKRRDIETFQPAYFYIDELKKRNIFEPPADKTKEVKPIITKSELKELAKDLSLVGIYWGPSPEIMIEDTASQKTYFLKKGDELKGIKIEDILKDRVILEYNNEQMEFM